MATPTLTTARLELRPIAADDLDDLAALYADPDVMRYIGTGLARTRAESLGRLHIQVEHWRAHGFGFFMMRLYGEPAGHPLAGRSATGVPGAFVGRCGLQYLGNTGSVELGYTLAK